jgi:S-adenosylmethionine decarboxylase
MTQNSTVKFGTHALVDFFDAQYLTDVATLRTALLTAAQRAGANVLTDHFHEFPERSGVTGVVLLEESHISIHTWPNDRFAAIDIFMCGEMSVDVAIDYLVTVLKPHKHVVKRVERGGVT